jgi:polyhydroxyalkanoate synthase
MKDPRGYRGAMTWAGLASGLVQSDVLRLWQGALYDRLGFAPEETPFQVVHAAREFRLRRYDPASEEGQGQGPESEQGPVLLIVPAPIKRAYIWDLAPRISVVRRCLAAGFRVYLVDWCAPASGAQRPQEQEPGLAEYAGRLIGQAVAATARHSGAGAPLAAGHSLGGTLAAIFAARHPERLRGLVLLEAPAAFGAHAGAFAPLVAAVPDARLIRGLFGDVPGSFLNVASAAAAPEMFVWNPLRDALATLGDPPARDTHHRVMRWARDEMPLPGRLFEDIVELLYRRDALMRGTLVVDGRAAGPAGMTVPLLSVADPDDRVIPPGAVTAFHDAVPAPDRRLLWYHGDRGTAVRHVGVLVGDSAHRDLWPAILAWLTERWTAA